MKVSELIVHLERLDQNAVIILQKDAEGNGYSPLSGLEDAGYTAESTWSGVVRPRALTKELEEAGFSEEDIEEDGEPCVVLWPVN